MMLIAMLEPEVRPIVDKPTVIAAVVFSGLSCIIAVMGRFLMAIILLS
jgi:hypothetical protein